MIELPSSYNSRFLIAKGNKIKAEGSDQSELPGDPIQSGIISEDLRYMQSILNDSHYLIAILDRDSGFAQ